MGQHNTATLNILAFSKSGEHAQLESQLSGFTNGEVLRKALKNAAKGGHVECVKLLLPLCDQAGIDKGLCEAAKCGHLACVHVLTPVANAWYDNSRALYKAAEFGFADVVAHLAPLSDPDCICGALSGAARLKHERCVDVLLPYIKGMFYPTLAISGAQSGQPSIVAKILEVAPGPYSVHGLIYAITHGNTACAQLLMKACDPTELHSRALVVAFREQQWEMFDLLYPKSQPQKAHHWIGGEEREAWEQALARGQRIVLNGVVGDSPRAPVRKM